MASEPTIALITGGTSGIGRAVAQLFGRQGASVIVTGRDEVRGRDAATETAGRFIRADLASPGDVQRLASEAGDVDVLVNNAGYWELGPSAQTTEAGFDAMVAVNFRGPFFLTAALAPKMAARGHGAIVNVSTMVAARGAAGMAAYGASKAALDALTRSWATRIPSGWCARQRRRARAEPHRGHQVHGRDARHPCGGQPPGPGERAGRGRPRHRLPRR